MFEKLRKPGRAKSIVAYVIFGAICLVFVFFGVATDGLGGLTGGSGAAVVNSEVISISQFRDVHERLRSQQQDRINSLPADQRREYSNTLRSQALNLLIDREVIVQNAVEAGILISDAEVRTTILELPWLQEEGRFRRERYDNYLRATRATAGEFEERVRKDLISQEIQKLFTDSMRSLAAEAQKDALVNETKINIEFARFDKQQIGRNLKIDSKDIKAFADSADNSAEMNKYYGANAAEFTDEEQVRARHILIKVDEKAGAEADAKALEKIKGIAQNTTPENFGEQAAKHSEGPTKAKQGDLGFFARGRMVKAFEEVAFKLKVGEVSEPVKSPFGYHLIKVEEKKPGGKKSFDEVKTSIARKLMQNNSAEEKFQQLKKLAESGDKGKLKESFKSLNIPWEDTSEFRLGQARPPKLGAAGDEVMEKLLPKVKVGQLLKEVILTDGKYYVAGLKSLKVPEAKKDQDENALAASSYFASRRANEALTSWREAAREQSTVKTNSQILGSNAPL